MMADAILPLHVRGHPAAARISSISRGRSRARSLR